MRFKTFGGLCLNGDQVSAEIDYIDGASVRIISQAADGQALTWRAINGLLVSTRILLWGCTYNDLDVQGLINGRPMRFDGVDVTVRAPRLIHPQRGPNGPSEWDGILEAAKREKAPLSFPAASFWGSDTPGPETENTAAQADDLMRCMCRCVNAYFSVCCEVANFSCGNYGWLPILEPVPIQPEEAEKGRRITVWHNHMCLTGNLEDVSGYDLVLDSVRAWPLPDRYDEFFRPLGNKRFVIDRSALTRIHPAYEHGWDGQ